MNDTQDNNNIHVVEDESIITLNLKETLNNIGYKNIDIALNSKAADNSTDTNLYDLAILDFNIDNKYDGIELATNLKNK